MDRVRKLSMGIMAVSVVLAITGIVFYHNETGDYCAKMQRLIEEGQYAKALKVGSHSRKSSPELSRLRAEALQHEHLLGELLFEFPVAGGATVLDSLITGEDERSHEVVLCRLLLQKNLDSFARAIKDYYPAKGSLPKHFQEALVMYNHSRSNPVVVYTNPVKDADYADYQKLYRRYGNETLRNAAIRDLYGNTYWSYYALE